MSVLPWPGVRAWPGAERAGGQERDQQDERRQVGRPEDRRQLAAAHAARARDPATAAGRRDGPARRRVGARAARRRAGDGGRRPRRASAASRPGMSNGGERRATGRGHDGHGRVRRAPGSAGPSGRSVRRSEVLVVRSVALGRGQRHARAGRRRSRASRAGRRTTCPRRSIRAPAASGAASAAPKPHTSRIVDRPPTPGGNVRPASSRTSAGRAPSTVSVEDRGRATSHAVDAAGVGLVVGDLAVAVGVEAEAGLEGRDLGLVDDDVEQDPVGLDPDARRSG